MFNVTKPGHCISLKIIWKIVKAGIMANLINRKGVFLLLAKLEEFIWHSFLMEPLSVTCQ